MKQHTSPSRDSDDLQRIQVDLQERLLKDGPDFQKIAEELGKRMLSARNECLLVLALFADNSQQLEDFLRAAEPLRVLKPATIPSLLKRMGKLDEQVLREQNVVDVLKPAA